MRHLHRILPPAVTVGCLLWSAGPLVAQAAAVVVRDGSGGPPVVGALIRLIHGDSTVAQGLTSEAGRLTLRAPSAGKYLITVSRIGYAVGASTPVELSSGDPRQIELTTPWNQISLPEIMVEGKTFCGKVTAERALAATLWDQIRQALTATSLSEGNGLALRTRTIDRALSSSGAIREEHASSAQLTGSRPFPPVPPELLARLGYVRVDADSVVYNAPDAETLLADPFVETHCFGVRTGQKADSANVGLTFDPLKTRRVADIRGVLWVDRRSLELRSLEFHYVSSNQSTLESNAWGRLEFSHVPSGSWYIRSWFIRMPEILRTIVKTTFHDVVAGFREHGATAEAVEGPARPVLGSRISGRVTDSLAGGGLAGVIVTIAGAAEFAVTDSMGAYAMAVPVAGLRVVTFEHPLLLKDTLRTQRVVELVAGGLVTVSTSTVGPETMRQRMCASVHGKAGLLGRVVTETGAPAPGAYVRAEWPSRDATPAGNDVTTTNEAGLWSFCDLWPGSPVELRVGTGRGGPPAASVEVDDANYRWVTLAAARTELGPVTTVDSAQRLPDLKATGKIPVSGSQRFEAEVRDRIQRNGAPSSALISRAELARSGQFRLANLLMIHGLRERTDKNGRQTLVCPRTTERPAIFLNGLLVDGSDHPAAKRFRAGSLVELFDMENLSPDEVEAVEVYRSPGEWPAEFDRTEASCLVVIWSRRGEKQP